MWHARRQVHPCKIRGTQPAVPLSCPMTRPSGHDDAPLSVLTRTQFAIQLSAAPTALAPDWKIEGLTPSFAMTLRHCQAGGWTELQNSRKFMPHGMGNIHDHPACLCVWHARRQVHPCKPAKASGNLSLWERLGEGCAAILNPLSASLPSGRDDAPSGVLKRTRFASLATGFPFAIVLLGMTICVWMELRREAKRDQWMGDASSDRKQSS